MDRQKIESVIVDLLLTAFFVGSIYLVLFSIF